MRQKLLFLVAAATAAGACLFWVSGSAAFSQPATYAVHDAPWVLAVGDLNGDAKPDLAVGNTGSHDVSVLLGNGAGSFSAATNYPVDGGPSDSIAIGDLNGDGAADIATLGADYVSVIYGAGDGTFGSPQDYFMDEYPYAVAIGDLNGDGKADLLSVNAHANDVSVRLGASWGLGPVTNYPVGDVPLSLAVGDLNGDGHPDVVTGNQDSEDVSVLLGDGDGTLQTAVAFPTVRVPQGIHIADMNGDGDPDLVVDGQTVPTHIGVMLGAGDGSFDLPVVSMLPFSRFVGISDVNGDGKLDLVGGNYGKGFPVALGRGDGTLGAFVSYDTSLPIAVGTAADLNGDGWPDLIGTEGGSANSAVVSLNDLEPGLSSSSPGSPANDNNPLITGQARAGTTVKLYAARTNTECTDANLLATGTAATFASPGLSVNVPDDTTTTIRATVTDGVTTSDCSRSSVDYVEDSTPPPEIVLNNGTYKIHGNYATVTGTAEAGSTVTLYDAPTTDDCTLGNLIFTTGAENFSDYRAVEDDVYVPPNSTVVVRAIATDAAGNSSPCSSTSVTFINDSIPPGAPVLTGSVPASPSRNPTPTISGTAEPGSTVQIWWYSGAGNICPYGPQSVQTTADQSGAFSVQVNVGDGRVFFRAQAFDEVRNASPCSKPFIYVVDVTAPTIESGTAHRSGHRYAVRLRTSDDLAGVAHMQLTGRKANPGPVRLFQSRFTYRSRSKRFYVRVEDRAGNWSAWKRVKIRRRR
jgi:hypothetical protein